MLSNEKKKRKVVDIIGFWREEQKEKYTALSMLEIFEAAFDEIKKKKKERD